jgi:anti-sigma B factor antagonist
MDLSLSEHPDEIMISLSGRFDEAAVAEQRSWFETLAGVATKNICIDLTEVTFIDSSAVGIIAHVFKRLAARQKRIFLASPSGQPLELLKLLRIDRVITIRSLPMHMVNPTVHAYETTIRPTVGRATAGPTFEVTKDSRGFIANGV